MRKTPNIFMSMIFAISALNSFGMQDCIPTVDNEGDVKMRDEGDTTRLVTTRLVMKKIIYSGPLNKCDKRFIFELCRSSQNEKYLTYEIIDGYDKNKIVSNGCFRDLEGDFACELQTLPSLPNSIYDDNTQISYFDGEKLSCLKCEHLKIWFDHRYPNTESRDRFIFTVNKNIKFLNDNEMKACFFYSVFSARKIIYRRESFSRKCKK